MHARARKCQVESVAIILSDRTTRLERRDDDPVVDQFQFDDVCRGPHGGVHGIRITLLEAVRQIARRLIPNLRRIGG